MKVSQSIGPIVEALPADRATSAQDPEPRVENTPMAHPPLPYH